MLGRYGKSLWGLSEFIKRILSNTKLVAVVGDTSNHGGSITSSNQDGKYLIKGQQVAVNGALFSCPIHGTTNISSVITKTFYNGKLLITSDAVTGCGARIVAINRGVYAG
jgi:uncharacterized Zn-binding protein involved in type VI secretion